MNEEFIMGLIVGVMHERFGKVLSVAPAKSENSKCFYLTIEDSISEDDISEIKRMLRFFYKEVHIDIFILDPVKLGLEICVWEENHHKIKIGEIA